ncbi:subtilisin-like protease SBT3.4 [Euphorbia lathyris]|uniref:subtilisin-like protease SBT3.4 n=1 Tax=Euphorbia lathyris TaxID=212925 RepID=UPI003313205C
MQRMGIYSLCCLILVSFVIKMGESEPDLSAKVHIVHTEKPQDDEEHEAFHLRTLADALGSDDAAKNSMLYSYNAAACGFSAKLTPDQVQQLSGKPGIIQIVASSTYHLHGKSGKNKIRRPGGVRY